MAAVNGAELEAASDDDLRGMATRYDVFARTSPEHKLRLVMALQANGEIVAMTGDGVNDAPALKRANVGVAMGIKGTESTKEAAEMVLADDNFASIVSAIAEGRTTYDNLRKAILFILSTNGAEALVVLAAVVFGLVLPMTPVQILWVNLVTAVTLGMALGFDPAEAGVMQRPPRRPGLSIFGAYFLWRLAFVSLLLGGATIGVFLYGQAIGAPLDLARTMAVNTLVVGEACYLFNCRYLHVSSLRLDSLTSNRVVWITIAILAVFQLVFVYAPFMNTWFGTTPMHLRHWLIPLGIGLALFAVVELEKMVVRSWKPSMTPS
jgi:magnesium-transporting ATPase (P-type)